MEAELENGPRGELLQTQGHAEGGLGAKRYDIATVTDRWVEFYQARVEVVRRGQGLAGVT